MKQGTPKDFPTTNSASSASSCHPHLDDTYFSPHYFQGCGEVFFYRNYAYEQTGHPYMNVMHNVNIGNVAHIMQSHWKMSQPRIVTMIISNLEPVTEWSNNPKLKASFQHGLMKAANTTKMWLLTNGANIGITKIVGEAVSLKTKELLFSRTVKQDKELMTARSSGLNIVGILREDLLRNSNAIKNDFIANRNFTDDWPKIKIESQGNFPDEEKFELEQDHTHFLIVRDDSHQKNGVDLFLMRLLSYLAKSEIEQQVRSQVQNQDQSAIKAPSLPKEGLDGLFEVPVVALLVKGGYECTKLVTQCLSHRYPLVVLQGTGGLADLIASAYSDLSDRTSEENWGSWDPEFVENYLKPELHNQIMHLFPKIYTNSVARSILQNRVMEILRLARQGENQYLTVLEGTDSQYENLSTYLLQALFKVRHDSKRAPVKARAKHFDEKIFRELSLTLDWNCAQVAQNEVLIQDPAYVNRLPKDLFMNALLMPDRHDFIDLFLSNGFRVHSFITPTRLRRLYIFVCEEEFFRSVCWEGVLGHSPHSRPGRSFVKTELNWLIETCTGIVNFVNPDHLYYNVLTLYVHDAATAERQAIAILAMWALFSHRIRLARVLWSHTDQPIHLALIMSIILNNMAPFVSESNIRTEYELQGRIFGDIATGVLNQCYQTSAIRALELLSEKTVEWNGLTAVDIAAIAKVKVFIAHPCCQKWLTNRFMGKVRIRELSGSFFSVPTIVKILSSAYLILPMYFWVLFKTDEQDTKVAADDDKVVEDCEDEDGRLTQIVTSQSETRAGSINISQFTRKFRTGLLHELKNRELFLNQAIPLPTMIRTLWTAPITKFHNHQIFHMLYLGLLCYVMLLPSCANKYQDLILSFWTLAIAAEFTRRSAISTFQTSYTTGVTLFDVFFVWTFLILYSSKYFDILSKWFNLSPYSRKVLLSFAIVYFFYRLVVVFMTISATLGPWIYRLQLMVIVDFVNFMKMSFLVIVAGGVVIQALLYPDAELSSKVMFEAWHRAWYSLYITPVADLDPDPGCSQFIYNGSEKCYAGRYKPRNPNMKCPTDNIWPYLYAFLYFILLKLILLTILYAFLSNTATQIEKETDLIWKYQRYALVTDFVNRLPLPPPLSPLAYPYMIIRRCCHSMVGCCYLCCTSSPKSGLVTQRTLRCCPNFFPRSGFFGLEKYEYKENHWEDKSSATKLTPDDYNYWKLIAREYEAKIRQPSQFSLTTLSAPPANETSRVDEIDVHKRALRRMSVRITELERIVQKSVRKIENFENITILKLDPGRQDSRTRINEDDVHVLARQSPYPGTSIRRARVPDNYVAWEVMWLDYEPPVYTMPISQFPANLQSKVDQDLMTLIQSKPNSKLPAFHWNSIGSDRIDRTSWIPDPHKATDFTVYKIINSIPVNPRGRTGLAGKGSLPRWGPNHYVIFLITRSQAKTKKNSPRGSVQIDCIIAKGAIGKHNSISLPMSLINDSNLFKEMEGYFELPKGVHWTNINEVEEYFRDCVGQNAFKSEYFSSSYMDDSMNTDNAWREVKLFHFHLTAPETLSKKIDKNKLSWTMVNESMIINLPSAHSIIVHKIMKSFRYTFK